MINTKFIGIFLMVLFFIILVKAIIFVGMLTLWLFKMIFFAAIITGIIYIFKRPLR